MEPEPSLAACRVSAAVCHLVPGWAVFKSSPGNSGVPPLSSSGRLPEPLWAEVHVLRWHRKADSSHREVRMHMAEAEQMQLLVPSVGAVTSGRMCGLSLPRCVLHTLLPVPVTAMAVQNCMHAREKFCALSSQGFWEALLQEAMVSLQESLLGCQGSSQQSRLDPERLSGRTKSPQEAHTQSGQTKAMNWKLLGAKLSRVGDSVEAMSSGIKGKPELTSPLEGARASRTL